MSSSNLKPLDISKMTADDFNKKFKTQAINTLPIALVDNITDKGKKRFWLCPACNEYHEYKTITESRKKVTLPNFTSGTDFVLLSSKVTLLLKSCPKLIPRYFVNIARSLQPDNPIYFYDIDFDNLYTSAVDFLQITDGLEPEKIGKTICYLEPFGPEKKCGILVLEGTNLTLFGNLPVLSFRNAPQLKSVILQHYELIKPNQNIFSEDIFVLMAKYFWSHTLTSEGQFPYATKFLGLTLYDKNFKSYIGSKLGEWI